MYYVFYLKPKHGYWMDWNMRKCESLEAAQYFAARQDKHALPYIIEGEENAKWEVHRQTLMMCGAWKGEKSQGLCPLMPESK